jgi:hypothetical protein
VAANGHPATEEPTSWAARSATERSST